MTAALLPARAGHRVVIFEREKELGRLWAAHLDSDGIFLGENSCKVYQSTYHSAPALFRMLGTGWEAHFTERHDLGSQWLTPFIAESSWLDLAKLAGAFLQHLVGIRVHRSMSVAEFLASHRIGDGCQAWMRATALGGITGTLDMTMRELFHRLRFDLSAALLRDKAALHWNARPPNCPDGFVTAWSRALDGAGVKVRTGTVVAGLSGAVDVATADHEKESFDAVFLAVPSRAMAHVLAGSPDTAGTFGHPLDAVQDFLRESAYEHDGVTWTFDRDFPRDLPLGGNNVRRGWHPILVQ